ncbi:helix-turn-helix domain-containing protein [Nocardia asiatica]|uniref:helix-turn-helix domain-containing protein n=1 Tax=Nocardia asiatica TaxID=209252 RepID=UPI002453FD1E|nr:helix-turn-helix transcriptional regulator [Nocardia asiatica]
MDAPAESGATVTGVLLRAARETAGLSVSALASRTHYSKALLGLLETGRRPGPARACGTYS